MWQQDAEWIEPLLWVLDEFRKFGEDVTVSQIASFLVVAKAETRLTQRDIMAERHSKASSQSRIIAVLAQKGDRGSRPWNLIKLTTDPHDGRRILLSLTQEGNRTLATLRQFMVRVVERHTPRWVPFGP